MDVAQGLRKGTRNQCTQQQAHTMSVLQSLSLGLQCLQALSLLKLLLRGALTISRNCFFKERRPFFGTKHGHLGQWKRINLLQHPESIAATKTQTILRKAAQWHLSSFNHWDERRTDPPRHPRHMFVDNSGAHAVPPGYRAHAKIEDLHPDTPPPALPEVPADAELAKLCALQSSGGSYPQGAHHQVPLRLVPSCPSCQKVCLFVSCSPLSVVCCMLWPGCPSLVVPCRPARARCPGARLPWAHP